jgi:hypothetical protein
LKWILIKLGKLLDRISKFQPKREPQQTTMMANQHTIELLPHQEHSRQPDPTNQIKPKPTTYNPKTPK